MKRAGKTTVRAARATVDAPFFERLSQHFEHVAAELEHLVEEQHAVVRQADFAWPRMRPAADERGIRNRVVRSAKGTFANRPAAGRQQAGHRMNRRGLERFFERQRRQNAGHPPRHHRLARARRAHQQQVVAAGGRNFERPARQKLAAHVGEIEASCRARWRKRDGRRGGSHAAQGRSERGPLRRATTPAERRARRQSPPRRHWPPAAECRARPSRRAAAAIGSTPRAA